MAIFENEKVLAASALKLSPIETHGTTELLLQHEVERLRLENETLMKNAVKNNFPITPVTDSKETPSSALESQIQELQQRNKELQSEIDARLESSVSVQNLYKILDNKQRYITKFKDRLYQLDPLFSPE